MPEHAPDSATDRAETLLYETTSLCRECKNAVPARVVTSPSAEVWMRKICRDHGEQSVRLSTNAEWYEKTRAWQRLPVPPRGAKRQIELGCPFDCGPCDSHTQRVRLPVVTITSACNLDCPICYVHNKNDDAFNMSTQDFESVLERLRAEHGRELDILNLTGGEPTLHPDFLQLLERAQEAGVHRVTICSNGIRLAHDERLVVELKRLGARVALSFDSFETQADYALQGAHLVDLKLRCLDLLEKHQVDTTLIPVMTKGVNDHEIGRILEFGLQRSNVRHIEIHTMTFTGQSGASFPKSGRISTYEVLERIEATTAGLLSASDFVPSPCAHPLCYQIAYLLIDPEAGPPIPFTRFMSRRELSDALADRLYLEPTAQLEASLRRAIDRAWTEDTAEAERVLRLLKHLLSDMFPRGGHRAPEAALRAAERAVKAVYIHSHMDEDTFDTERARECCDSNCYADGTTIPVCNYNVLFREKEHAFNRYPKRWNDRRNGQKTFVALPVVKD